MTKYKFKKKSTEKIHIYLPTYLLVIIIFLENFECVNENYMMFVVTELVSNLIIKN